jgi:hypothetical protein
MNSRYKKTIPTILSKQFLAPNPDSQATTFPSSQLNNRGLSQESSKEQDQRVGNFVRLYVPAFLSVKTLFDLDDVFNCYTAERLTKAQI